MRRSVILVLSSLSITACIPEQEIQTEQIGTSYSQCVNHPSGTGDELPEVTITVNRQVPADAEIRCSDKKAFSFEGREVSLVYVAYGALQDCPSGCFSSHVCGIYDPDESKLYSFAWYGAAERPLSIPPDCPELAGAESGQSSECGTPPQGFLHTVTATAEFESFRNIQREQNGDWRFCF